MAAQYVLAFDQGTTSSRAIVFDNAGTIVATSQREFQQHFPRPGWVEHDAAEIWSTQFDVATDALKQAKLTPAEVSGIGITNQRETTVVWEKESGRPIHNAIVWQDRRTAETCRQIESDGHLDVIRSKTGLLIDAYFSATKVAWILDHVAGARARAERGELAFGTIDSWLAFKLTEGRSHITDASNASRTMLFNIQTLDWDEELLEVFRVPKAMLPEVVSSSGVCGEVASSLALGGIPIAGIAGDQQSALFGQTCFEGGQTKNTYGTGCFMLRQTGEAVVESMNRLLCTVAWQIDGRTSYALEGSVFTGGSAIQWLRDGLKIIKSAKDVEPLALSVKETDGVMFVPALTGLGAPHWDPHARGALLGLTRGTTTGHIARAALEGIAFQVADLADSMCADCNESFSELRVDGGAAANDLLMQIQADLMQVAVTRPVVTETTALGAAYLAGLATGVWQDQAVIAEKWEVDRVFEPQMSSDDAAQRREKWRDAVARSKAWEKE